MKRGETPCARHNKMAKYRKPQETRNSPETGNWAARGLRRSRRSRRDSRWYPAHRRNHDSRGMRLHSRASVTLDGGVRSGIGLSKFGVRRLVTLLWLHRPAEWRDLL